MNSTRTQLPVNTDKKDWILRNSLCGNEVILLRPALIGDAHPEGRYKS